MSPRLTATALKIFLILESIGSTRLRTIIKGISEHVERFDFVDRSKKCGYVVETHHVVTRDNYRLKIFRIPPKQNSYKEHTPVLLQHGLLCDSNYWILNGCTRSLPYMLNDNGHDVWVSNSRGTLYSNEHLFLNDSDDKYWEFTFDEMAKYDVPDILDYIMQATNSNKLNYIGHSQGTEIMFGAPSFNPNITSHIKNFIALAPVAKVDNIKGLFRILSWLFPSENIIRLIFGSSFFPPKIRMLTPILKYSCSFLPIEVCSVPLFMIDGYNPEEFDKLIIKDVLENCPSTTSINNVIHYYQGVHSKKFQYYDYGILGNVEKYGQSSPPLYQLDKCDYPVHIIAGTADWLAPLQDVKWLESQLPNVSSTMYIEGWTHLDVVLGKNAPEKVFTEIIRILSNE